MFLRSVLALYAASLLLSISGMDFFISLLVLYFLFWAIKDRKNTQAMLFKLGFEKIFTLFFIIVCLGLFINRVPETPVWEQLFKFRWMIFLYCLVWAMYKVKPGFNWGKWFSYILIPVGLFCFYQHFTGMDVSREKIQSQWLTIEGYRVAGFLGSPMVYAHSFGMVFCFIFAMSLFYFKHKEKKQWHWLLSSSLILLSLILTYTRGVWISVFVASVLMCFLYDKKFSIYAVITGIAIMGVMQITSPYMKNRLGSVGITDQRDQSNYDRVLLWKTNIDIFKEHPMIGLGYGENQRRIMEFHQKYGRPQGMDGHAHNTYLQFLSGTGILGLLCYLTFIVYLFYRGVRLYKKISSSQRWHQALALGGLGAVTSFYIGGLTEANFERAAIRHMFLFSAAVILWIEKEVKESSTKKSLSKESQAGSLVSQA